MKKIYLALLATATSWCGVMAQTTPANPIADYYPSGYPAWTDSVNWGNRVDMSAYANGANDFEKFENARDQLAAQGGGVLYYPAGTYNFADHPSGLQGRGLWLKKGVVILGERPTGGGDKAIVDSANAGLSNLGTIFQFPFHQKPTIGASMGDVPDVWNQVGLYAGAGQRIADQTRVGIAWVKLVGAYVYFGPDMQWNPTYGQSIGTFRKARKAPNAGDSFAWSSRVPDGTLPFDPFTGSEPETPNVHTRGQRFVFGCRLENSCINNEVLIDYIGSASAPTDSSDPAAFAPYRFAGRLNVYGPDVFVANNSLPKPDKNFYYNQKIKGYRTTPPTRTAVILYDYAKTGAIDVNKQLVSQRYDRCNYITGNYVQHNVVIKDNWVYNHGHKGFEVAGKYMVVDHNVNWRNFLAQGDDVYGLGNQNYVLTLDGWSEDGPNSDNLARAFDVGGQNVWFNNNFFTGTGSNPGNDGEGILYQPQGGIIVASNAETFNRMGNTGKDSYISPYDTPVYGMFQFFNYLKGAGGVGVTKQDANRVEDFSVVKNFNIDRVTPLTVSPQVGTNIADWLQDCPVSVALPPDSVQALQQADGSIRITWKDIATNEIGYRIDRKLVTESDWKTVVYRPRNQTGSVVADLSVKDNGNSPPGCQSQGAFDLNKQEWNDYLYPANAVAAGAQIHYRVVAINCANDDQGTSDPIIPVTALAKGLPGYMVALYPNPATERIVLRLTDVKGAAEVRVVDALGKLVATQAYAATAVSGEHMIATAHLANGLYRVIVTTADGKQAVRSFVKN